MSNSQVIAFISAKSGVGKSTAVVNVAHQLANFKKRICVIDLDMFFGELHVSMGMEQFYDNKKTLEQALLNTENINDCLISSKENENIWLLPSSRVLNNQLINITLLKNAIQILKNNFDYILLDVPNGTGNFDFLNIDYKEIDKLILVSSHTCSSVTNTDSLIEYFELSNRNKDIYLILTNFIEELGIENDNLSLNNICTVLNIPLLGVVSYDKNTFLEINKIDNNLTSKKSINFKEYETITEKIIGISDPISFKINIKDKKTKKFLNNPFTKNKVKTI